MPRKFLAAHGVVQGVGFRAFVKYIAERNSIRGFVRNIEDGSVEIFADGSKESIKEFIKEIKNDAGRRHQVFKLEEIEEKLKEIEKENKNYSEFSIEH